MCPGHEGVPNVCGSVADMRTAEVEAFSGNSNLFAKRR